MGNKADQFPDVRDFEAKAALQDWYTGATPIACMQSI
jgi:hypothetical protein